MSEKILFTDLDGTLLNSAKKVSPGMQLLLSKIRLGLTGLLTVLVLLAFLLWGPRLHRSLQNADHAFDSLESKFNELGQMAY